MNTSLVVALVLLGGSWVVLAVALRFSVRHSELTESAVAHLAAKSASWRPHPDNRVLFRLPSGTGSANRTILNVFSSSKDLTG